jgi:large subunit ribosomal protein L31
MAKTNIHPQYYDDAKVTCACGNTFTTGSTQPTIKVELCAKCHPFFTGQQKFVDTLGQVDRFQKKQEVAKVKQAERKKILETRAAKTQQTKADKPSLKDLLMQARKASS